MRSFPHLDQQRHRAGDTAFRLGRFFGTAGEFWLNLQKLYELHLAEERNGAAIARLPALDDAMALPAADRPQVWWLGSGPGSSNANRGLSTRS